jgi:putative transcriptional regulator
MGYLERGEYNPSLELALKISRAVQVPLEQIFWLDDDKSGPMSRGETS